MATENTPSVTAKQAAPVITAKPAKQTTTNKVCLSKVNAFAIAFACFYGFALIIAAIAGFTTKWSFNVPFVGTFLSNTNQTSIWLITAIAALALGIFGIVSTNKLTDLDSVKKSWKVISGVFLVMASIFAIEMVATAIYSLMGIGRKSGVSQGQLWLNGFLAQLIAGGAAARRRAHRGARYALQPLYHRAGRGGDRRNGLPQLRGCAECGALRHGPRHLPCVSCFCLGDYPTMRIVLR